MNTFEIKGPDGAVYEIQAPDEASAIAAFKKMMGQSSQTDPVADDLAGLYDAIQGSQPEMPPLPAGPALPSDENFLAESGLIGQRPVTAGNVLGDALFGLGYLGQEATKGALNLAGAPADLVNMLPMALNILPGEQGIRPMTDEFYRLTHGEYPAQTIPAFGGGQNLNDIIFGANDAVVEAVTGTRPERLVADDPLLRILGRGAQEVGAMAVPAASAVMAGAKMGAQGARQMGGPIGNYVESAAVDPTKFLTKEGTGAFGAGIGAGVAREMVTDGDPGTVTPAEAAADMAGAVGGGLATAMTGSAIRAGGDMLGAITGKGGGANVKTAVAETLGAAAGAPRAANSDFMDTTGLADLIAGARRVSEVVPEFIESTGDVLKNKGLQALEYSRQSGPNSGMYTVRRDGNAQAVDNAISGLAPDATPGAFREPLSAARDDALMGAETAAAAAQADFEKSAQALAAVMSGEARGQTVRGALDDALGKAREVERQAWANVTGEVDPAPLAQAFEDVTSGLTLTGREEIADLSKRLAIPADLLARANGGMADLAEITDLRSSLQSAIRNATAEGNDNQVRMIKMYTDAIDAYLDSIPRIAEPLAAARATSFDLNERFTRLGTPIADVLKTRKGGAPMVPDSRVAGKFVQPDEGQASNIDRLLKEGDTPDVRAAIEDEIRAGAAPLLDKPDQLEAFLGQYKTVFDRFPDLRDRFGTAAALRREAQAKGDEFKSLSKTIGPNGTSAVAKYLKFGDERAVDAMSGVVNAQDPAKAVDELLGFVGNAPDAVEGARSAFWKLMERKSKSTGVSTRVGAGEDAWRPSSLYNFLRDPKVSAVADRLYADNPEHLANLRGIAEELRGVDLRTTAKAPNTSGTPQSLQGNQVLPSAETLGAYGFAYQRGQVGAPFIALRLVSVMGRRAQMIGKGKQFQTLLDQALLNPDLAAQLMRENSPANVAAMSRMAKTYLGVRSAWVDEVLVGSDDGEDETINAIMGDEQ